MTFSLALQCSHHSLPLLLQRLRVCRGRDRGQWTHCKLTAGCFFRTRKKPLGLIHIPSFDKKGLLRAELCGFLRKQKEAEAAILASPLWTHPLDTLGLKHPSIPAMLLLYMKHCTKNNSCALKLVTAWWYLSWSHCSVWKFFNGSKEIILFSTETIALS